MVVALGLVWRSITDGDVAKLGGDALYALMVLALAVLIKPSVTPWLAGAVSVAFCWAIEFLQLTPLPAALSERSTLARLVLGSAFHWLDLVAYVAGAGLGVALRWLSRVVKVSRGTHGRGPLRQLS